MKNVPFTVDEFQDLLRLLEMHPEWRADLRRHVLSDELMELPALVRQLVEAQARTESRIEELAQAQARTESRIEELAQAQAGTERHLAKLAETQAKMEVELLRVATVADRLGVDVAALKGEAAERRYSRLAPAYFSRLARRIRVLESQALADLLDDAVEDGRLTEEERTDVLRADLVFTGRRRDDQVEAYFVVEVSVSIDAHDVERAADRSVALAKLGRPTVSIVAGESINGEAAGLAQQRNVWRVLNGVSEPPVVW